MAIIRKNGDCKRAFAPSSAQALNYSNHLQYPHEGHLFTLLCSLLAFYPLNYLFFSFAHYSEPMLFVGDRDSGLSAKSCK